MTNLSPNSPTTSSFADSFAALFESLSRQEMRSGEVITAEVVSVDSDHHC